VTLATPPLIAPCQIAPETQVVRRENRSRDDFSVDVDMLAGRYGDLLPGQ
jgi:hypothetical protein